MTRRSAPVGTARPAGRGAGGWVRALPAWFTLALPAGFTLIGTQLLAWASVVAALPGPTAPGLAELSRFLLVLVRGWLLGWLPVLTGLTRGSRLSWPYCPAGPY